MLPTVSKTHFTPLKKKSSPEEKKAQWWLMTLKRFGFRRRYRKHKSRGAGRARGERKTTFTHGKFPFTDVRFCLSERFCAELPTLTDPVRIPPEISPNFQTLRSAVAAHGRRMIWCSIRPTGDLPVVISITSSSSSSVHGLHDQLFRRGDVILGKVDIAQS